MGRDKGVVYSGCTPGVHPGELSFSGCVVLHGSTKALSSMKSLIILEVDRFWCGPVYLMCCGAEGWVEGCGLLIETETPSRGNHSNNTNRRGEAWG